MSPMPPSTQHLQLLPLLTHLMLLLHLGFAGVVMVTSALSVGYRRFDSDLARRWIELAPVRPATWLIFGLIPLICLPLLMGQSLHGAELPITLYLAIQGALGLGALALLGLYRRTLRLELGALGHFALVGSCFLLTGILELATRPERWPPIRPHPVHLLSIQLILQFGLFSLAAILLTGALTLVVYRRWPDRRLPEDHPQARLLRYWGLGLAGLGTLGLPPHLVLDLATAPGPALSWTALWLALGALVALLLAAMLILALLRGPQRSLEGPLFVAALVVFSLLLVKGESYRAVANQEYSMVLALQAREARQLVVEEQSAGYTKAGPDPELGARVFQQRCTACHLWDRKLVGPPYRTVLPKYQGLPAELASFLRRPSKIDPDYPPMPNQGLTEQETLSVTAYLLAELESSQGEEGP